MDHRVCVAHYYLIRGGKIKDLANIYCCTLYNVKELKFVSSAYISILLLKQFLQLTVNEQ